MFPVRNHRITILPPKKSTISRRAHRGVQMMSGLVNASDTIKNPVGRLQLTKYLRARLSVFGGER